MCWTDWLLGWLTYWLISRLINNKSICFREKKFALSRRERRCNRQVIFHVKLQHHQLRINWSTLALLQLCAEHAHSPVQRQRCQWGFPWSLQRSFWQRHIKQSADYWWSASQRCRNVQLPQDKVRLEDFQLPLTSSRYLCVGMRGRKKCPTILTD